MSPMNPVEDMAGGGRMQLLTVPLLALALLSAACGPQEEAPPTFTTRQGVEVWVYGRDVSSEQLEEALEATVAEFSDRYPPALAREALKELHVSFLDSDTYPLYGQQVAGNLGLDGRWVYVGAQTRTLDQSAFVHELVHYFDVRLSGTTDETHSSWEGRIYSGITRVNQQVRRGAVQGQAGGAGEADPAEGPGTQAQ